MAAPMPPIARRLANLVVAIVASVLTVSASAGAPGDWVVVSVRGTVLKLVDDSWQELLVGEVVVPSGIVRTLRSGRLVLQQGEVTLSIGGDAALEVDLLLDGGVLVNHFLGAVAIDTGNSAVPITVETTMLTAVAHATAFSVTFDGNSADVKVTRGQVLVADINDRAKVLLGPGQSVENSATGFRVAGTGALPEVAYTSNESGVATGGSEIADAGVDRPAGSSGSSEGGSSPGSSNAGGNSGGGDNGNAGGGNNGNAGGNGSAGGNGNAGGGGNGNAGGGNPGGNGG
jgi:hypothetical protein